MMECGNCQHYNFWTWTCEMDNERKMKYDYCDWFVELEG